MARSPLHRKESFSLGMGVERALVAAFLFSIPFQTRLLLFRAPANFPDGEWTRGWLWASDLIFLALLGLWVRRGMTLRALQPMLLLLPFLPAFLAHPSPVGAFSIVKIAEGLLVFSYARAHRDWLLTTQPWPYTFLIGLGIHALAAIAQFALQHDLGLRWLGESPMSPDLAGVAKVEIEGGRIVRAYGFTPHPNILGAMLLSGVALVAFLYIFRGVRWLTRYSFTRQREEIIRGAFLFLFIFGIIVTFSRLTWASTAIALSIVLTMIVLRSTLRRAYFLEALRFSILLVAVIAMGLLVFRPFVVARATIASGEESLLLRQFYAAEAVAMISAHPLLGVGAGNFVPQLVSRNPTMPSWQAQPVHNVLLLIASEYGLIPTFLFLIGFLSLVITTWRRIVGMHDPGIQLVSLCLLADVTALLLLSSFDHFLWTSQQGRMMLWFTLGLLAA